MVVIGQPYFTEGGREPRPKWPRLCIELSYLGNHRRPPDGSPSPTIADCRRPWSTSGSSAAIRAGRSTGGSRSVVRRRVVDLAASRRRAVWLPAWSGCPYVTSYFDLKTAGLREPHR